MGIFDNLLGQFQGLESIPTRHFYRPILDDTENEILGFVEQGVALFHAVAFVFERSISHDRPIPFASLSQQVDLAGLKIDREILILLKDTELSLGILRHTRCGDVGDRARFEFNAGIGDIEFFGQHGRPDGRNLDLAVLFTRDKITSRS